MREIRRGLDGSTLEQLLRKIRLIVFDFDGVFTDNRVLVGEDGSEYVFCSRADGLGLATLRQRGIDCMVLSTETNPVVAKRCDKLKLECFQGCADKWKSLRGILQNKKIDLSYVGYVGNDINDLSCMENVGVAICVADAAPEIKAVAHLVTSRRGGEGAVREICDLVIRARNTEN